MFFPRYGPGVTRYPIIAFANVTQVVTVHIAEFPPNAHDPIFALFVSLRRSCPLLSVRQIIRFRVSRVTYASACPHYPIRVSAA